MAEDQIRIYEPDPLRITSIKDIESCEKNLVDTLTRVSQRKVIHTCISNEINDILHSNIITEVPTGSVCGLQEFLLSNHLSSYDPSSMQVNSQITNRKINIVKLNLQLYIYVYVYIYFFGL